MRWVLVCCQDNRCGHHVEMDADCWPNDIRLSDIEDRFVCQACGKRGGRRSAGPFHRRGGWHWPVGAVTRD